MRGGYLVYSTQLNGEYYRLHELAPAARGSYIAGSRNLVLAILAIELGTVLCIELDCSQCRVSILFIRRASFVERWRVTRKSHWHLTLWMDIIRIG